MKGVHAFHRKLSQVCMFEVPKWHHSCLTPESMIDTTAMTKAEMTAAILMVPPRSSPALTCNSVPRNTPAARRDFAVRRAAFHPQPLL
jgi:hypothetical protein